MAMSTAHRISGAIHPLGRLRELLGASIDVDEIRQRVTALSEAIALHAADGATIGIYADNAMDWVIADLALQQHRLSVIPIPGFFSAGQINHLIQSQQIALVLASDAAAAGWLSTWSPPMELPGLTSLRLYRNRATQSIPSQHAAYRKLTFTSGTTGQPKGVALPLHQQWQVAHSLRDALAPLGLARHLCLLPLSVLLENLAGVYAGLAMGAEVVIAPLSQTGLLGASGFDAEQAVRLVAQTRAQSVILLPQMLRDMTIFLERANMRLPELKFVAVGGGKVSPNLITQARALGLPVYEGYGLSEASSVVALNRPGADRVGSVGMPLPHVRVRIADDGEILLTRLQSSSPSPSAGAHAEGNAAMPAELPLDIAPDAVDEIATGDIGRMDSDGYLYVTGRKKNVLITSFGRNVSPEWPEALLTAQLAIAQAFVYGEAAPQLSALIVPSRSDVSGREIDRVVAEVNRQLPDYARIGQWSVMSEPFSYANGLLTANGRMRREEILKRLLNGTTSGSVVTSSADRAAQTNLAISIT